MDRLGDRLASITAPFGLLAHFSYHKCLTVYYQRVMAQLADEFGFQWVYCNDDSMKFHEAAVHLPGPRVVVLNNNDNIDWDLLPNYRGSHFIRDPRDVAVSGYHYHLWTREDWCVAPRFNWDRYVPPALFEAIEPDPARRPRNESYQEYLKQLDPDRGLMLESLFAGFMFAQMARWNYRNPSILELRYEDMIGNEQAAFARLFDHYRFPARMRRRGLEVAHSFSLAQQPKGEGQHLRRGEQGQWQDHFTRPVKALFKRHYGDLLIRLGYEKDLSW